MSTMTSAAAGRAGRPSTAPVLSIRDASLGYGDRLLWSGLDLDVAAGQFVAILGPNGSGKTSLLRAVLGTQPLTSGRIEILGEPVRRGHRLVGYVPQQHLADRGTPLRARDFLALGIDGDRFGLPLPSASRRRRVDAMLDTVNARAFARTRIGSLSGGEQQRLRIGQALIGDSSLLLCDEPLISLDLHQQRSVSDLIDASRRETGRAVLMITHDVNPVLDMVDTVVYLANGRALVGSVDDVFTSSVLSDLYETPVEVLRARGRIIVVGLPDHAHEGHEHAPHGVGGEH